MKTNPVDTVLAVKIAAALCRRFESLILTPYLCPAGVPTIGYGSTHYENGVRVTLRDPPITKQRAEEMLLNLICTKYLPATAKLCPGIDDPEYLAAIIDFTFNLGVNALKTSTLRKRINAFDRAGAKQQLMRWNKAGGRVLRGLTLRRSAEVILIK